MSDHYTLYMTGAEREILRDALGKLTAEYPLYGARHLLSRITMLKPQPARVGKVARSYPIPLNHQE